jgi:uncharacterized protein involved in exopolysaccharide biosynthesis
MSSENKSAVSARDFVETFFRQKQILLLTMPVVVLGVGAFILLANKRYESEMKVLVQNTRSNIVISAQETGSSVVSDVTEQQTNSQLEILHSRDVLDSALDPSWSGKSIANHTPDEIRAHNRLLIKLEGRLDYEVSRKSNIITVTYQGNSPEESQETLQRIADSFLAEERRVQRPSGTSKFFVEEAENYRQAWNDAAQKYVDFQQANKIFSLPDQLDSVQKDTFALQGQLRQMDVSLNELQGRLLESAIQLQENPPRQVTVQKSVPNQEATQQLNTLEVQLENKRTTLLTQFKPNDRAVQEIDKQIEQTRAALDAANRSSAQEETTDVNPSWEMIRGRSLQDQISRKALLKQRAVAEQQLANREAELSRLQSLSVQYHQLESKADGLKENYQLYMQKRDQAQIEDKMDAQQLLNVTIAEHPTFSNIPVSPRPLRSLGMALLTGIFISFALIYVAELSRSSVVTPRELEMASSYPVLATIPLLSPEAAQSRSRNYHTSVYNVVDLEQLLRNHALVPTYAEEKYFDDPPRQFIQ